MTVHFKGISEYQNKYKVRQRRPRNPSPHRRMRLAGLRSDQLRISREPQFQTKRRVPVSPPQASRSLQWKSSSVSPRQQDITKPVVPVQQTGSVENVETPLAPRPSKPPTASRASLAQGELPSAQTQRPSAEQQKQATPSNQVNHVLRRKAGLKSGHQRNCGRDSEYRRQFQWKTPVADSPLLTAQQERSQTSTAPSQAHLPPAMLYSSNRNIPPFKCDPAVMETEYMRSFKGSPPPKPPCLRRDVELNAVLLPQMDNPSPDKSKKKQKENEQYLPSRSRPRQESEAEPQSLQQNIRSPRPQNNRSPRPQNNRSPRPQNIRSPRPQNNRSPKALRKAKTEYSSNFCSPLQYRCRDGGWVKSLGEEVPEWYHEVRQLRERAEAYRRRAWGSHFSRQHLSQILSTQNHLWEASSSTSLSSLSEDHHSTSSPIIEALDLARADSVRRNFNQGSSVTLTTSSRSSVEGVAASTGPTLPVQRQLAWEEEVGPNERGVAQVKLQGGDSPFQQPTEAEVKGGIRGNTEDKSDEVTVPGSEPLSTEVVSEHLIEDGRVPTPKLKAMLSTQRTHHDRTTPATGGAVLVSPPKTNCTRKTRRSEATLGKAHSPYRHHSHTSPSQALNKSGCLSHGVLAAGMATVDPLPLNQDLWAAHGSTPSPDPAPVQSSTKRAPGDLLSAGSSPHANRIQGTMRDPEFQHNGYLGLQRPESFLLPSSDSGVSDNDDRMSQISCRSAASCFMASQVLERTQKRTKDFWRKTCS